VPDSSGIATATLLSEGSVPPTGIVTVLAFTRGEESFLDNNGNGRFDCDPGTLPPCHSSVDTILFAEDHEPEPFIDFRPLPTALAALLGQPDDSTCTVTAPSSLCNDSFDINKPFELFVDSNGNGLFDTAAALPVHPASGNGTGQGTPGLWDNNIFVWDVIPVTFSGHLQIPKVLNVDTNTDCSTVSSCFNLPNGGGANFVLQLHDDLLNPIVGGSTITKNLSDIGPC
jgi:hypothetical protein